MSINGVNSVDSAYTGNVQQYNNTANAATTTKAAKTETAATAENAAAVYEKTTEALVSTEESTKSSKMDKAKIEQMLKEAEQKKTAFRTMVEKMFNKQGQTASLASGLAEFYRGLEVPAEVSKAAQEEISEDGYWGVEQTSDRILSFAQAIAGTDKEMAGKMLDAVKEGFKQAQDAWGEELPSISQQTMDKSIEKINAWIDGLE